MTTRPQAGFGSPRQSETGAVKKVLSLLRCVKQTNDRQWQALCPVHETDGGPHKPSLSISVGEGGRVLLHCHAGCETTEVLRTLGLQESDLFADNGQSRQTSAPPQITATYDYCDAAGSLLYQVVRFAPKDFRQRRPDGKGGWIWKMDGVPRVLYRLRDILSADPNAWCFACEGEKDATRWPASAWWLAATRAEP